MSNEFQGLVEEAQNGSQDAFREIFEQLSNKLFTYALSRTSSREDALDISQETFIELWNSLRRFKYRTDEEFLGFVFIITKRKLYKYYKNKNVTLELNENLISESYQMKIEDYRFLQKHIDKLASKYQDVLKLRYWSGLKFGEIALFLNIKETTAKVLHHRAIKQLQVLLNQYENII